MKDDIPRWARYEIDALQRRLDDCRILAAAIIEAAELGDTQAVERAARRLSDLLAAH